jgi:hypothetical protein
MSEDKKKEKAETKEEPKITDILEEYFIEEKDGPEMVRRKFMSGDKLIKEEVSRH